MPTSLPRSKVKKKQTWNAESVFDSPAAFDAEVESLVESLQGIKKFQSHLGEDPNTFIEAIQAINLLSQRAAKVQVYASLSSAVDTADQPIGIILVQQHLPDPPRVFWLRPG
ncbi:MAG: hypothetical protein L0287_24505 [Anaerolineae bacterium]|nr:hypothetical protein [Anaerolineae bacterium]MCI0609152.1 hypothetical protein [Anaerolineae bacterium]